MNTAGKNLGEFALYRQFDHAMGMAAKPAKSLIRICDGPDISPSGKPAHEGSSPPHEGVSRTDMAG